MSQLMLPEHARGVVPVRQSGRVFLCHPVFGSFADPYFRLSPIDQGLVFAIQLDEQEATLPVPALMVEFGIGAASEDGRMLALIERALDYVTGLRIGDPIPLEVLTGEPSWTIDPIFHDLAVTRLNMNLLGRNGRGEDVIGPDELRDGEERLAGQIGDISAEEVRQRLGGLADQLAFVEALRAWLLRGAVRMGNVLARFSGSYRGDHAHKEILSQIRRLNGKGVEEIEKALATVDHVLADLRTAVSAAAATEDLLRDRRNLLYRRWRAWEPYCREWSMIDPGRDARTWMLAHETYRFLAPRYMNFVEWRASFSERESHEPVPHGMQW